jgi:hypothetical protein
MAVLSEDVLLVMQLACRRGASSLECRSGGANAASSMSVRHRSRGRLRSVTMIGGLLATVLLSGLLVRPCSAMQPQATSPAAAFSDAAARSPQPPEPEAAMKLFAAVQEAVRSMDAAKVAEVNERSSRLVASAVTLRFEGRIVGRGVNAADDGATLRRAVEAAVAEAASRLPTTNAATSRDQLLAMASRVAISLELSGDLVPMTPATYSQIDLEVLRGLEGVAARFGQSVRAVSPATMLANGTSPGDAMIAAISAASGDAALAVRTDPKGQPDRLAADRGAVFYKFPVSHLAQVRAGATPTFLFRGGKVVSDRDITVASMRQLAESMVDWLLRWDSSNRVASDWPKGTYFPSRGGYEPPTASLAEFAIVTYAVHRFITVKEQFQIEGQNPWTIVRPGAAGSAYLRFGAERLERQPLADAKPGPMFACLRSLVVMAPMEHMTVTRGVVPATLSVYDGELTSVFTVKGGWNSLVPENARAFAAFVLARRATIIPGEVGAEERLQVAQEAVRSLYRETKPTMLVMHMPWLGMAERLLAGTGELPAAAALRDMRDLVWKFQMTDADAGVEGPDLVGGIVFTSSSELLPTAQSLRPLAFIASMLADPRLTDVGERPMQLSRLLRSVRFIRQLTMDEWSGFAAVDPAMAAGGVRASLWDSKESPEATALGLITVCNTLESLGAMTAPPRPAQAPDSK